MTNIPATTEEVKAKLIEDANVWYTLACEEFRITPKELTVNFTLKNRVAGTATGTRKLDFNIILAKENWGDFGTEVVAHEVAHLIVNERYPYAKQSHGREFRFVTSIIGAGGKTYHNFDISSVSAPRKVKRYVYSCNCSTSHVLTSCRHNRLQSGTPYICRECKGKLTFVEECTK